MDAGVQKARWTLTREALEEFLAYLDHDRDRAAEAYEQIRRKLITFFRCNGFPDPEDYVDETIDRVIKRRNEVEVRSLMPFIRGVARHVASEVRRRGKKEDSLEELPELSERGRPDPDEQLEAERRLACLEECAKRLCPEDRDLILAYYKDEKSRKIENKRKMAADLGVTAATLRVRAFRVRQQLAKCVTECMQRPPNG